MMDHEDITLSFLLNFSIKILYFSPSSQGAGGHIPWYGVGGVSLALVKRGYLSGGSGWVERVMADTVTEHSFTGVDGWLPSSHLHRLRRPNAAFNRLSGLSTQNTSVMAVSLSTPYPLLID